MLDDDGFEIAPIGLKVVSGPATGATGRFERPDVLVGRSRDCVFPIDDPTVSRLHFSITFARGRWELTDAGSSSGTAVNGVMTGDVGTNCVLHDGDRISVGTTVIVVTLESERVDTGLDDELMPDMVVKVAPPAPLRSAAVRPRSTFVRWLPWALLVLLAAFLGAYFARSC